MILYHGAKRTPKEMAAILVREKLEELPKDWTPETLPNPPSASDRAEVVRQIQAYQVRFYRILAVAGADEDVRAPALPLEMGGAR